MTHEELTATVQAQGCLIRALVSKLSRPQASDTLSTLFFYEVKPINEVLSKANDAAGAAAFKQAYHRISSTLPPGY